jgi:hypothetical protein
MEAVILTGGLGIQLSEETSVRPEPMVESRGAAHPLTFGRGRWDKAVWLSCLLILASSTAWTYALWPGSVTDDTLILLRQVETNIVTDYFPILNGILLRIFVLPFHSIVPYVTAQVLFCICATIYVIITLRNIGAPAAAIVLASLFIATSIPIGAYWTMTFKDVPCAFAIVALACQVFAAFIRRKVNLNAFSILAYVILLTVAGFFRQGWQALLIVVPGLLIYAAWTTLNRRAISLILGVPLILFLIFQVILPRALGVVDPPDQTTKALSTILIQPFVAIVTQREGYSALHKETDEALLQALFIDPSKVASTYNSISAWPLLLLFRPDIDAGVPVRLARRLMILCALNVGLCLRDRVSMLFGTLQASAPNYSMAYYNLADPRLAPALVGGREFMASVIERYNISAPEYRSQKYARQILDWTEEVPVKAFVWDAIPQFLLLLVGLLCFSRFPATAAACFVLLLMAALQSAVISGNDFRYLFFIYLGGVFVIPMMIAEYRYKGHANEFS